MKENFKCGFISIIGPPNSGKSTLINNIIGYKVAIISDKPQTTRNRILGIKSEADSQLIFIDTPGIHESNKLMNKNMVRIALGTLNEVDVVIFLIDASRRINEEINAIFDKLTTIKKEKIIVLNKVDLVDKQALLPLIESIHEKFKYDTIIPISALKNDGVDNLLSEIQKRIPFSPAFYSEEMYTDLSVRFLSSEIIREKLFNSTYQEIPYSCAVIIEKFKEVHEKNMIDIMATIFVERESQKGIIIGKGGEMLKKIGTAARIEIETLLEKKVFLQLTAKVREKWTEEQKILDRLGIGAK